MSAHPARLVLADHVFVGNPNRSNGGRCSCWLDDPDTGWRGHACDHPEHQADMLLAAGLLADGTPAETPTERVLAERDPWAYLGERVGEIQARRLVCGRCGAVAVPDGSTPIGLPQDWERFIVKGEARYACPACIEAAT